jgi:hypothetical protein
MGGEAWIPTAAFARVEDISTLDGQTPHQISEPSTLLISMSTDARELQ